MGKVSIVESGAAITIVLDGDTGDISAGGNGQDGTVLLKGQRGKVTAKINEGGIVLYSPAGEARVVVNHYGTLLLGGNGVDGQIVLSSQGGQGLQHLIKLSADSANIELTRDGANTIRLDGENADLILGGANQHGNVTLRDGGGQDSIGLDASTSNIVLKKSGVNTIRLDGQEADLFVGGANQDGNITVRNSAGRDSIILDGKAGDIILKNADCAEEFELSESESVDPGTVMVLDEQGRLRESRSAYDRKVAGVISGAGDFRPGILLDGKHSQGNRAPLALVGKVYCKVDARLAPIEVGDLLTTSSTPGHAMKAINPGDAFGAVIGKALSSCTEGRGLIPILVALQ